MNHPSYDSTRPRSNLPVILTVLVLLGAAFAGWYYLWPHGEGPVVVTPPPPESETEPPAPLEPAEPVDKVVKELKVDNALDEWLSMSGIVQRIAAATWRVSNGDSPAPVLGFLNLIGRFDVKDVGDKVFVDPASYRRYDPLIDRVVAVNPVQAAKAYKRLRPNFEAAFAEIAEPGETFDDVAKSAIKRVLAVQVPTGDVEVIGKGATFFYADETLESMSAADKHVLRLGPKNAKRVQDWVRKLASSAGLL